jgi:scyllo-inosamine-4-phosphate amidinotransferase 1
VSLVRVHNEWDPLEEVVIGTMANAQVPRPDLSLHAIEFAEYDDIHDIPSGPYPSRVVEETQRELDELAQALEGLDIRVRRPEPRDTAGVIATPDWSTDGFYDYCPRDVLLTVGDMVIETPMVLRSRFLEPFAYKDLLIECFKSGSRWISAPKPRLLDELFDLDAEAGNRLLNLEPAFDAANILRFGTDLLYLVSDSGNEMGADWLQSAVGDQYTVHRARNLYASTHVDSTIVPIRPGLVLLNPARVNDNNMPDFLKSWDKIWAPEMEDVGFVGDRPYCSTWIGMNLLVIAPGRVVVDRRQTGLIASLEARGVETLPLQLTHSRTLGGSFHCVSLDLRRTGDLETYS